MALSEFLPSVDGTTPPTVATIEDDGSLLLTNPRWLRPLILSEAELDHLYAMLFRHKEFGEGQPASKCAEPGVDLTS